MTTKLHAPVLILGSGPAGLTAAVYTARANLSPVVIAGMQVGGQLTTAADVENWPGDPAGISGPDLMQRMIEHAERFDTRIINDHIHTARLDQRPFYLAGESGEYTCDALIIATGASAQYLGLPSEQEFLGRGVSACAICDGFFFRNREVAVVGGGNKAINEVFHMSKIASKVTLIHRRDKLRAEKILIDRVMERVEQGLVEILYDSAVDEILGDATGVTGVRIRSTKDGSMKDIGIHGIFISVGHRPNTSVFEGQLEMNNGYIVTRGGNEGMVTATSIPGVFAAGDVQNPVYRQAITSAGAGCMAAMDVQQYLESINLI